MSLRDEIISDALRNKQLNKNTIDVVNEVIDCVMNECLHIARNTYIDCDPEQQATVDMVQQLIGENIEGKLS